MSQVARCSQTWLEALAVLHMAGGAGCLPRGQQTLTPVHAAALQSQAPFRKVQFLTLLSDGETIQSSLYQIFSSDCFSETIQFHHARDDSPA